MTTTNKPHTIFTVGYGGRKVRAAYAACEQHMLTSSGLIIDTRKNPVSPIGLFTQASLQRNFGGYYVHVPEVGNENYNNGGEIQLTDEETGLKKLEELLAMGSLLLLCGCTDIQRCHRRYIAEKLSERTGAPVVHLLNGEQMNRVGKVDVQESGAHVRSLIIPVSRESQKRPAARHVAEEVEQLALFEMPAVEPCQQKDEPVPTDWSGQSVVQNANPCVNLYGAGPDGRLCKDCSHFFAVLADKTYLKCDQRKITHGAGSDHRARWSACKKFEERSGVRLTVFVSH
jgi:hypothetical protein